MPDAQVSPDSIAGHAAALPPAFVCSWSIGAPDAAWVQIAGELDLATAPDLELVWGETQAQAGMVVLDLRELTFMDSSGVHAIVDASVRARGSGGRPTRQRKRRSDVYADRVFG
jgi:ABC-type transporter Mla MlaB component